MENKGRFPLSHGTAAAIYLNLFTKFVCTWNLNVPTQNCGMGLERGFAAFVVADANGFVDAADEDFAVADAAGARGAEDHIDCLVLHRSSGPPARS